MSITDKVNPLQISRRKSLYLFFNLYYSSLRRAEYIIKIYGKPKIVYLYTFVKKKEQRVHFLHLTQCQISSLLIYCS